VEAGQLFGGRQPVVIHVEGGSDGLKKDGIILHQLIAQDQKRVRNEPTNHPCRPIFRIWL